MRLTRMVTIAGLCMLSASPALAHTGHGTTSGFFHGFYHPLVGLDHLLAMLSVGLLASQQGDRARWLLPLSFVLMMSVGGALGVSGWSNVLVEPAIITSVIVLGAIVALRARMHTLAGMTLVGGFAVYHGVAHGMEMPLDSSGLAYGSGFVIATSILHAVGLGVGLAASSRRPSSPLSVRVVGGLVSIAGVALAIGWL